MTIIDIKTNGRIVLQSQISDSFEGFDDAMLFQLYNGQFWIQKEYKYWYHYAYMPRVSIYLYSGSNYLTIDGQAEFVAVDQLTDVLERTIISDFNGWSGDTIFELDNGQIWKQDAYAYHYSYSYRPKAIIYKSGYGFKMIVNGSSIKVKRIK
jgi:hypothetical protein